MSGLGWAVGGRGKTAGEVTVRGEEGWSPAGERGPALGGVLLTCKVAQLARLGGLGMDAVMFICERRGQGGVRRWDRSLPV